LQVNPKGPKQKNQQSKQRVTIIRTQNPIISGLYSNGLKVDNISEQDKYLVQELVYASDAHCYGRKFFFEESDMKYAWGQSRFIYETEAAIIEELLTEEE
jgi:hypothetical protein